MASPFHDPVSRARREATSGICITAGADDYAGVDPYVAAD
jgi:hypothetical protein